MKSKKWHFGIGELTGREAWAAWRRQKETQRCNCSAYPVEGKHLAECVYGTCEGFEAIWLGCPYCTGTAVGRPIVYR